MSQIDLTFTTIPGQSLPGKIAVEEYSTLSKSPAVEPHLQMQLRFG